MHLLLQLVLNQELSKTLPPHTLIFMFLKFFMERLKQPKGHGLSLYKTIKSFSSMQDWSYEAFLNNNLFDLSSK